MTRSPALAIGLSFTAFALLSVASIAAAPSGTVVNTGVSGGAQVGVPNQNFRYQNTGPSGALGNQPRGITIDETGKSNPTTPPAATTKPVRIDETGRVTGNTTGNVTTTIGNTTR